MDVITSYSIHYTKLYDALGYRCWDVPLEWSPDRYPEMSHYRGRAGLAPFFRE